MWGVLYMWCLSINCDGMVMVYINIGCNVLDCCMAWLSLAKEILQPMISAVFAIRTGQEKSMHNCYLSFSIKTIDI